MVHVDPLIEQEPGCTLRERLSDCAIMRLKSSGVNHEPWDCTCVVQAGLGRPTTQFSDSVSLVAGFFTTWVTTWANYAILGRQSRPRNCTIMQLRSLGCELELKECAIGARLEGSVAQLWEPRFRIWALKLHSAQSWEVGAAHCSVSRDKFVAWGLELRSAQFEKVGWGYVAGEFPKIGEVWDQWDWCEQWYDLTVSTNLDTWRHNNIDHPKHANNIFPSMQQLCDDFTTIGTLKIHLARIVTTLVR